MEQDQVIEFLKSSALVISIAFVSKLIGYLQSNVKNKRIENWIKTLKENYKKSVVAIAAFALLLSLLLFDNMLKSQLSVFKDNLEGLDKTVSAIQKNVISIRGTSSQTNLVVSSINENSEKVWKDEDTQELTNISREFKTTVALIKESRETLANLIVEKHGEISSQLENSIRIIDVQQESLNNQLSSVDNSVGDISTRLLAMEEKAEEERVNQILETTKLGTNEILRSMKFLYENPLVDPMDVSPLSEVGVGADLAEEILNRGDQTEALRALNQLASTAIICEQMGLDAKAVQLYYSAAKLNNDLPANRAWWKIGRNYRKYRPNLELEEYLTQKIDNLQEKTTS